MFTNMPWRNIYDTFFSWFDSTYKTKSNSTDQIKVQYLIRRLDRLL